MLSREVNSRRTLTKTSNRRTLLTLFHLAPMSLEEYAVPILGLPKITSPCDNEIRRRRWKFEEDRILKPAVIALRVVIALVFASTPLAADTLYYSDEFTLSIRAFYPGQTFTASESDLSATTFAFTFSNLTPDSENTPITMTLYEGEGNAGAVVASTSFTLPEVLPGHGEPPEFIDIPLSAAGLVPGATYSIVLTTDSYKVGVNGGYPPEGEPMYPGGHLIITDGGAPPSFCVGDVCDLNLRIGDRIFGDGFETGDLSVWSP